MLKSSCANQRGADITGAERRKERGLTEVASAGVAHGGRLAVIIGIVVLNQRIVTFADDGAACMVDDHRANRTAAFIVTFAGEMRRQPHEIGVGQLAEEILLDNLIHPQ